MTFRQWNSVITLIAQALISAWLINDAIHMPPQDWTASAIAAKLLWAALVMIVFSIVAAILVAIVGSAVRREEFKEERADERDKAVYNKSMRNAYYVLSAGGGATLILLALGYDPALAAYSLFGAGMLAGATDSISQLIYYRIG